MFVWEENIFTFLWLDLRFFLNIVHSVLLILLVYTLLCYIEGKWSNLLTFILLLSWLLLSETKWNETEWISWDEMNKWYFMITFKKCRAVFQVVSLKISKMYVIFQKVTSWRHRVISFDVIGFPFDVIGYYIWRHRSSHLHITHSSSEELFTWRDDPCHVFLGRKTIFQSTLGCFLHLN